MLNREWKHDAVQVLNLIQDSRSIGLFPNTVFVDHKHIHNSYFFYSLIINILAISHFDVFNDFKIIQDRLTSVSRTWLLFLVSVRSHGLCSQRSWNRQLPSNLLWWNETSYNEVYENIDKNLFIKNLKLLSCLFFK